MSGPSGIRKEMMTIMNSEKSVTASIITNITRSYVTLSEVIMKN